MPKGFLILLVFLGGFLLAEEGLKEWPLALLFPLVLGGGFDACTRRGVLGLATWLFLLFFGAVTGIITGSMLSDPETPFYVGVTGDKDVWGVLGTYFGAAVWVASYQAEKRSDTRLTRRPAILALVLMVATLIVTAADGPSTVIGLLVLSCFATFLWWSWAALQAILRLNPERQAIERESKRQRDL